MHSYLYSFDAVSSSLCLVAVKQYMLLSLPCLRLAQIWRMELLLGPLFAYSLSTKSQKPRILAQEIIIS